MDTPGYDPVSATGQVAGGANLICFTTGRGSCFGCKPSPSLKLATNTPMYQRMNDDMDINCGEIVDGTATVEEMGERIFKMMLETASGKKIQERRVRLRRRRIRALASGRDVLKATPSAQITKVVFPAKAGIQELQSARLLLDPRFRGDNKSGDCAKS